MTGKKVLAVGLLVILGCASLHGCGGEAPSVSPAEGPARRPASTTPAAGSRPVLITGRSVAYGWMSSWGYPGSGSVSKNGYVFSYGELDGENIASSFAEVTEGLPPGSVVFFKFCFVDFDGSNLARRERELDEVIATARSRDLKLVVGNALPVRKQDGNGRIVAEDREFNRSVERAASENPGVWVLDLNGILAGADGFLEPGYRTENSHPNDRAYSAIDREFFPLLETVFQGTGP